MFISQHTSHPTDETRKGAFCFIENVVLERILSVLCAVTTAGEDFRRIADTVARLMVAAVLNDKRLKVPIARMESATTMGPGRMPVFNRSIRVILPLRGALTFLHPVLEIMGIPVHDVILLRVKRYPDEVKGGVKAVLSAASHTGSFDPNAIFFLFDPMGATGVSALECMDYCVRWGANPDNFVVVSMFTVFEFVEAIRAKYPTALIYVARMNRILNDHKYIVGPVMLPRFFEASETDSDAPGDFGDRLMAGIETTYGAYYGLEHLYGKDLSDLLKVMSAAS